jgi:hypothetical protein
MSRIIKLTESQLRDMVTRVISEQQASVTPQQIWDNLSIAQAGMGGVGGTDEKKLIAAITQITSIDLYTQVVQLMRTKSIGTYKSIVQLLNGELESDNLKEFQQIQGILKKIGVTLTAQTRKAGQYVGAERGATFQYDQLVPGSIRQVVGASTKTPDPNKPTFRICTGFPIKYGCKQTEVGRLQQCLGLKVDYSFGPVTLKAILDKTPDPKMKAASQKQIIGVGLSEGAYKLLTAKCKSKPKLNKTTPLPAPVVDTRTKTGVTPLAPKSPQQLPVNIDLPKLAAIPTPGIDPVRKQAILGQIKDRGFDQVYKGQKLTDAEQQWLSGYMGGEASKEKQKASGNEKLVFPNR